MARIRTVKPSLFSSFSVANVPVEARYLYIGLFTAVDDDGRMIDSTKQIAAHVFPHDDDITTQDVDNWLDLLSKALGEDCRPLITRYKTETGRYISIPNWGKHQKISHPVPSALPNPPVPEEERF